jgi:MoxR-like ATPase
MSNAVETARNGIGVDVEIALAQAKEEFRLLMPQRHDLYIHAPDSEVVIEGRPHFQLQRMVNWLNLREHVWAAGPAGSGKTTAAGQAADALGLPHYILPCGMSTNDWSLLGFTNPDGKYIPGHMRQPFEHGGVFVLDEIDNTNPSVLTTINGALSGQSYQFPDANVPRHPDFVVVGCANTWGTGPDRMYVGRNQLDAATLDRFRHVEWGYDEEAEFDWAGRDQSSWVGYVQELRAMARDMRVVISPRASISGAKGIRNGLNWDEVAEDCIFNGMSEDDAARLRANYASR